MIYTLTRQNFVPVPYRHGETHFLDFEKCFQSQSLQFKSCHSVLTFKKKKITVHKSALITQNITFDSKQKAVFHSSLIQLQ